MLKKISVQQLQLGMHLKEFCGSWLDHPFWRTGFVLEDPNDIDLILASKIKEVWIDCSLGSDVVAEVKGGAEVTQEPPPPPPPSPPMSEAETWEPV